MGRARNGSVEEMNKAREVNPWATLQKCIQLKQDAYHEAGHFVAALNFDQMPSFVSISVTVVRRYQVCEEDMLVIVLAGQCAQVAGKTRTLRRIFRNTAHQRQREKSDLARYSEEDSSDNREAKRCVLAIAQRTGASPYDVLSRGYDEANQLVYDNREAIDLAAEEIIKHKTIDGPNLDRLFELVSAKRKTWKR